MLKRTLINCLYKLKYRKKHLCLKKSAYVLGRTTTFEGYNTIGAKSSFSGSMGYASYIGSNSHLNATVGKYCCIADRVHTVSGTHPVTEFVSIHPAFYSTRQQAGFSYTTENSFKEIVLNPVDQKTAVYIGNDVWIGSDVTILGGVKIGNGAIIAAGAVVTKDVAPYSVVGGIPAKHIKKRFSDEQIAFLEAFEWWNQTPDWLKAHCEIMQNIDTFMKEYSK